jgi:hypothetical protein
VSDRRLPGAIWYWLAGRRLAVPDYRDIITAELIGGPRCGELFNVRADQREIIVALYSGLPSAMMLAAGSPPDPIPHIRDGLYRRVPGTCDFRWEGEP